MAQLVLNFSPYFGSARLRNFIMPGSISWFHLIAERMIWNHLGNSRIEPGSPAEQASTPSITPLSHLYHVSKPTWLREQLDGSPIGNAGRFICRYKSQCCLHWVVPTRASWDNAKIIKARYSTVVGQYWHQDLVRALIGNKSFGSAVH